jgi:hypothetical protein
MNASLPGVMAFTPYHPFEVAQGYWNPAVMGLFYHELLEKLVMSCSRALKVR